MKTTKISLIALGALTLSFASFSCSNTASNNAAPTSNKSNTAVVVNTNQKTVNSSNISSNNNATSNTKKASNASTPETQSDAEKIQGELQMGKTQSVILYVGMETGDYAAYCFTNDSEAGKAILAACKDKERCEVNATIDSGAGCQVPGLEADLSASGKILKVGSAKSLGRKN